MICAAIFTWTFSSFKQTHSHTNRKSYRFDLIFISILLCAFSVIQTLNTQFTDIFKVIFCLAMFTHWDDKEDSNSLRCQRGDGWSAINGIVIDVRKRRARVCDTTLLLCGSGVTFSLLYVIKHFSAEIEEQQENTEPWAKPCDRYTFKRIDRGEAIWYWSCFSLYIRYLPVFLWLLLFWKTASSIWQTYFALRSMRNKYSSFLAILHGVWLLHTAVVSAHFHSSGCQPFNPIWLVDWTVSSAQLHGLKAKISACDEHNALCVNQK